MTCEICSIPTSGRFRLESLHPGVDADAVSQATGFALEIPDSVPTTAEPNAEQLRLLREGIDPFGTVKLDFRSREERLEYLNAILTAEWQRAAATVKPGVASN